MSGEDPNAADGLHNKRLDHNAKERIRRVRLKSSYSNLSAILPDSAESKKDQSSTVIVDGVLKYIPEMESEIENLKKVRDNIMQTSKSRNTQHYANQESDHSQLQVPTVSVTQVKEGEAIIQICIQKYYGGFSNLLQNLEARGISIRSTSMLSICDDKVCYQLHIEVPYNSQLPTSAFITKLLRNNHT